MKSKTLNVFGLIAPVWLVVGVALAGALYPGYSHFEQAMSELHALGSPVQSLSPLINNYPLGILFAGFGLFVFSIFKHKAAKVSAVMIILHGVGSILAGYFPCDVGCNPDSTSLNQTLHGIGGLIMLVTLLIAPAIWIFIARKVLAASWFGWISVVCVLLQLAVVPLMAAALDSGEGFGFYQRIAYGIPLIWLFLFAALLLKHQEKAAETPKQTR